MAENGDVSQRLLQAQRMEAIGQLASGMAHDFTNLLTVIAAHVEFLDGAKTREEIQRSLQSMRCAVEQGTGIARALLSFHRRMRPQKVPIDLGHSVDQAARMLHRLLPAAIELKSQIPHPSPWIEADPVQLQHVVLNLAVNSRDAMTHGGVLELRVRDPGNGKAVLEVEDTGPGIPEEVRERVFEPFFTTHQGTGLGLSVVQSIVQDHAGTMELDSRGESGSCFRATFPKVSAPPVEPDSDPAPVATGSGQLILLAEDDSQVRAVMGGTLVSAGYSLCGAADGREALDRFEKQKEEIALVVLDLDLPYRNGVECLAEIRERKPHLPAILVSGNPPEEVEAMQDHRTTLLMKPFPMAELTRLAHSQLNQGKERSRGR